MSHVKVIKGVYGDWMSSVGGLLHEYPENFFRFVQIFRNIYHMFIIYIYRFGIP